MKKIIVTCTKAAKQTKAGWVFDILLPDGQTAAVWAGPKTDINQFAAVAAGTKVELAVGNTPGKYFFNKIAENAPASPYPAAQPLPQEARQQAPETPRQTAAERAKELAGIAAATWIYFADKTAECPIPPGPREIQKLVVTILIGSTN
jgi:sugar phosphate isomerase/epimerase